VTSGQLEPLCLWEANSLGGRKRTEMPFSKRTRGAVLKARNNGNPYSCRVERLRCARCGELLVIGETIHCPGQSPYTRNCRLYHISCWEELLID